MASADLGQYWRRFLDLMPTKRAKLCAKGLTELLGTTFLCFTIGLTGASATAPIAIGCVLMVMVYAGGHVSGGHYNPAVTLAVLIRGEHKVTLVEAVVYVLCQFVGCVLGAVLCWPLITRELTAYPKLGAGVDMGSAILAEFVVTLALCSVVLHTATTKAQANNSYYGLAIGFTVLSGAISVGPISGGAFNPAVGFMPVLYDHQAANTTLPWVHQGCNHVWIYFLGPLVAGLVAGVFFRMQAVDEYSAHPNPKLSWLAPLEVETFGTMMLCFTVGTAAASGSALAPLSIGSMLMVMVYCGGSISGSHYNPAISLAVAIRSGFGPTHDLFGLKRALQYMVAQLLGAVLGTLAAWGSMGDSSKLGYPSPPASTETDAGVLGEVLGTFLLAYTVLNVATVKRVAGNSFFGLAIGMVVTAMAFALGPITGGAFNPAVAMIGPFSGGKGAPIDRVWIYWVACPLGAALAAVVFRLQNYDEFVSDCDAIPQHFAAHAQPHEESKPKFMCHAHTNHAKAAPKSEATLELEV